MSVMLQTGVLADSDLSLLGYVRLMADTAQTDAAKKVFELFTQKEIQRLKTVRLMRSRSRS